MTFGEKSGWIDSRPFQFWFWFPAEARLRFIPVLFSGLRVRQMQLCVLLLWGMQAQADWQQTVADDLAGRAVASPVDFVLYLGDNFYSAGVTSIADPLWGTAFTDVYDFNALPYFYAIAGNHDHRGSALSQVDYSYLNPVWRMPALSYAFSWMLSGGEQINFLGIDTTILVDGGIDTEAHLQWIKRRLEAVSGGRIIVFGHHPVYSAGSHGDTHVLVDSAASADEQARRRSLPGRS